MTKEQEFIQECEELFEKRTLKKLTKKLNKLYDGNDCDYYTIINELIFHNQNKALSNFVENFVYMKEQEYRD